MVCMLYSYSVELVHTKSIIIYGMLYSYSIELFRMKSIIILYVVSELLAFVS